MLNIGTTEAVAQHPKRLDRGGFAQWATRIAPTLVQASSRGGPGAAEHLVGRRNYRRFDAQVPGGLYALDSVDHEEMAGIAASMSRELSPVYTDTFAEHQAAEFAPLVG